MVLWPRNWWRPGFRLNLKTAVHETQGNRATEKSNRYSNNRLYQNGEWFILAFTWILRCFYSVALLLCVSNAFSRLKEQRPPHLFILELSGTTRRTGLSRPLSPAICPTVFWGFHRKLRSWKPYHTSPGHPPHNTLHCYHSSFRPFSFSWAYWQANCVYSKSQSTWDIPEHR